MEFRIRAQKLDTGEVKYFTYDNMSSALIAEDGEEFILPTDERMPENNVRPFIPFSPENPVAKSKQINRLKIQFGMSCNYSCDYCSQRFVPYSEETNKQDIPAFIAKLDNLEFNEEKGLKIELWGGEPLVYWKTLKPMVEALNEKFASWERKPVYSMITNGSLLTKEICKWLDDNNVQVSISHDGPGQSVRGPDPFDDPVKKETILSFYYKRKATGKSISFNSMLNGTSMSRKEIHNWFIALTEDPNVPLGEGAVVDAYDEGGINNSLNTKQKHFEFRKTAFNDIYENNGNIGFGGQIQRIDNFTTTIINRVSALGQGQKCGMEDPGSIAVNLRGEISTCQNVSAESINSNGQPHLLGTIDDIENAKLTTSTHWSKRPYCRNCPVLRICQGSCMFLDGKFWDVSCENSFSDAIWVFALSLFKITGYVPTFIESDKLPDHRKDIWGDILEHKEEEPVSKIIPIKVMNDNKIVVNDVEVYTHTHN